MASIRATSRRLSGLWASRHGLDISSTERKRMTGMLFLPEAESLGQDLGIAAIGGADGVLLHSPERPGRDHSHGDTVVVSLLNVEILVPEGGSQPGQEIEAESVGRQIPDSRIVSAQIFGGYLVDAGVREDRPQSELEAFHVLRVGLDEKIEISRRASQPVQPERHGAEHGVLDALIPERAKDRSQPFFVRGL